MKAVQRLVHRSESREHRSCDCINTRIDGCTAGLHSAQLIRHTPLCGVARRIGARFGGHLRDCHGSMEADVYGEAPGTGADGFVAVAVAATIERTSGGRSKASRRRVQNTM